MRLCRVKAGVFASPEPPADPITAVGTLGSRGAIALGSGGLRVPRAPYGIFEQADATGRKGQGLERYVIRIILGRRDRRWLNLRDVFVAHGGPFRVVRSPRRQPRCPLGRRCGSSERSKARSALP
jgi:hypothetical protein